MADQAADTRPAGVVPSRPAPTLLPAETACPACGARMAYEGHCKLRCTRPCGFFMGCSEGW